MLRNILAGAVLTLILTLVLAGDLGAVGASGALEPYVGDPKDVFAGGIFLDGADTPSTSRLYKQSFKIDFTDSLEGHSCAVACGSLRHCLYNGDAFRRSKLKDLLPHVGFLEIIDPVTHAFDVWQQIRCDCQKLRGLKFSCVIGMRSHQENKFEELCYLDCSGCGMTDDLLGYVTNREFFPRLRYLDIRGHKIAAWIIAAPAGAVDGIFTTPDGLHIRFK
jgi:hypothetical protein